MQLEFGGERLQLLAQRAAYLPDHGLLLVADLHLGKAVSFRRQGVPVPRGTTSESLARLTEAVDSTGARGIVFLGDLLHAAQARAPATWAAVARWRERHAELELTLVRGNHDRGAGDPPPAWRVHCVDEPWRLARLALAHHPLAVPGACTLAGHLHPALSLRGRAHDRLRLPCFHFGPDVGVLPAFGAFTGMHAVQPKAGDRLFVIADDRVQAVSGLTTLPR